MNNSNISVFGNEILLEIIKESKLFSEFKIEFFNDLAFCIKQTKKNNGILIYLNAILNKNDYEKLKKNDFPIIMIFKTKNINLLPNEMIEGLLMPFNILQLKRKIVSLFAKYQFKKTSLINLSDYVIDKNERKIKKNNLELQLTEKEINFLILFSEDKEPLSRNFILKNIWHYSIEADTHTVETHIHRLRKKILEKFGDNNFIKNNEKGYYV